MKTQIALFIVALGAFAGAAKAASEEAFYINVPHEAVLRDAIVANDAESKAHFLAERHMWRVSGMQQLSARQHADQYGASYEQAKARYNALVASSQFSQLVDALASNPRLEVLVR